MNNLKTRRSLALLLGAMLIAVPVSSFAGDDTNSDQPSAPGGAKSGGIDSGGATGPSSAGSDNYSASDTGTPDPYLCSSEDPCTLK